MDLLESCKDKLAYFRIKELKDVLTHLGLSKQGKKQDLVDRILTILSEDRGMWGKKNAVRKEEVAKLVDDTYRKMQVAGAADLASKSQATSDGVNVKPKEEAEDSYQMEKVRCLCGRTLHSDSMIKCEDPRCGVWQHMACVLISEKPLDGIMPSPPDVFYCEICRLSRADPFWVNVAHPLLPVKLNIANAPADGSSPGQSIERTFQLTRADRDLLSKQEYDVQAWCMLLNDKVLFRMQWPQYVDLQINGVPVRAINRPGSQLLGANGRDDGPVITPCTRDGINKISVKGCDARVFCVGVRIVKRRTLQQVLNMIPKEGDGEPFEEALTRVRRCVGGGDAAENADSDSDVEVVADFIPVNLRCPMSGLRMKVAGRFKPCPHMGCFDLEVFVEMNQRSRKWQCPICLKNYSLEKIIIDPYFNRITSKMRDFSEDVADIEVKPDGSWRAKSDGDRKGLGALGMWHLPDGTVCSSSGAESKQRPELKPVKQEGGSNSHAGLKLGIRKNRNGCWEFNKSNDITGISPANNRFHNFESNGQNMIPMSSSATGSGRDCEDGSVNQDGGGNLDFSAINGLEYESMSMNFDPTVAFNEQMVSAPTGDAEVIVLSDSDDDIEPVRSSEAAYKASGSNAGEATLPVQQNDIVTDPYYENATLGSTSGLGVYGPNDDDFGINMWPMHNGGQGGPGFQLFGSDMDVSDALADMQHGPLNSSSAINGFTLTGENPVGSDGFLPEPNGQNNTTMNDSSLVDNPMAFGDDPSLQIFLPTRPSDSALTAQQHLGDRQDVANSVRTEDWISLRLGDGSEARQEIASAPSGLSPRQHLQSEGGALDSLAEHASLLAGMNDNVVSGKTSRERTESPLVPRQKRSVRPRLYLSIDSESE